jgi:hypothetical protein
LKPSALRAGDHVWRVATAFQASIDFPWNMVIGAEAMYAAITLIQECMESVQDTFSLLALHDRNPLVRVRTIISTLGPEGIERGELLRRAGIFSTELDRVLGTLGESGEAAVVVQGNMRRIFKRVRQPEPF